MANQFNAVKVFSATMVHERERLGEAVTEWINANPKVEIIDRIVSQSSDASFHCLAITLFVHVPAGVALVDTAAAARASRPIAVRRRVVS